MIDNFAQIEARIKRNPHYEMDGFVLIPLSEAEEIWNAATRAERERCAKIAADYARNSIEFLETATATVIAGRIEKGD